MAPVSHPSGLLLLEEEDLLLGLRSSVGSGPGPGLISSIWGGTEEPNLFSGSGSHFMSICA